VRRSGGEAAYARIRWQPNPLIQRIVAGWPRALDAQRAAIIGFAADTGIDEVVEPFIEHDFETRIALALRGNRTSTHRYVRGVCEHHKYVVFLSHAPCGSNGPLPHQMSGHFNFNEKSRC
jgi:hypothetical protein